MRYRGPAIFMPMPRAKGGDTRQERGKNLSADSPLDAESCRDVAVRDASARAIRGAHRKYPDTKKIAIPNRHRGGEG